MNQYKEIYLQNKANEFTTEDIKKHVIQYLPFYHDISNDDLAYLLAYFHYKLNELFSFLNYKIDVNRHFNADESRDLISLINSILQVNKELEKTIYFFNINEKYKQNIELCKNFLQGSGGSTIPEYVYEIEIIESSPIFYLKNNNVPIEETIIFNEYHIHEQWKKALERKKSDPEAAITTARTLIESILKYILDENRIKYTDNTDLSELYKEVAKLLNLAPEQHQEQIFKQILGGANGIISGLGALRNKLGDAHGKSKINIKPKERHSELAVNLAGAMALFLYETFKEQENK